MTKSKRLFQVLMVAAALWVSTPGTAQATTFPMNQTLTFSTGTFQGDSAIFGTGPNFYEFGLIFDQVLTPFTVAVSVSLTPNVTLPAGYTCVPLDLVNCIQFTATPSDPNAWLGNYVLTITWQADTNPLYPNTPVDSTGLGRIRILHFDSNGVTDITLPNSYCTTCVVDPSIGGKDDNFSDFIVATTPLTTPEPATMVLLGSGLALLALRLRRRR